MYEPHAVKLTACHITFMYGYELSKYRDANRVILELIFQLFQELLYVQILFQFL
jgi:hypothetical protein